MDADEKPRSQFVRQLLGQPAAETEPAAASKDSRPAVPTPMLDIVMASGEIESFSYAYLTRVSFDPSGILILHFGDDKVHIEGRNLWEVRQKLRLHKADEVREGMEQEGMLKPDSAAHIDKIRLEIAEEIEEEKRETGRRKSFAR